MVINNTATAEINAIMTIICSGDTVYRVDRRGYAVATTELLKNS